MIGLPTSELATTEHLAEGAALLERIRALGYLLGPNALVGEPVSVELAAGERVVVRWAGHVFQEIDGRLVVARRGCAGEPEIAYLDGPEPSESDAAKFAVQRVLVD